MREIRIEILVRQKSAGTRNSKKQKSAGKMEIQTEILQMPKNAEDLDSFMDFLTFFCSVNYYQKKCRIRWEFCEISINVTSTKIEVIIAVTCSFLEISKNLLLISTQQEV